MEYIENFGDKRQTLYCVYCGGAPETREHIPPRVFLDEPYPEHLPTVGACLECNQKHSLDEEYVACLVECAKVGSANPKFVRRDKIRRILLNKPSLSERFHQAMVVSKEGSAISFEIKRMESVLLKLAQCHLLFENNEPPRENPINLNFGTLDALTEESRDFFETVLKINLLPEVGSRSMQRMLISGDKAWMPWIEVQAGNYRYLVPSVRTVRIVIGEHVWCQVEWE